MGKNPLKFQAPPKFIPRNGTAVLKRGQHRQNKLIKKNEQCEVLREAIVNRIKNG